MTIEKTNIFLKNSKQLARKMDKKRSTITVNDNGESLIDLKGSLNAQFSTKFTTIYLVRKTVAKKLQNVTRKLKNLNMGLLILDAWRPPKRQRKMWQKEIERLRKELPETSDSELEKKAKMFISPPGESPHCTGGAVDVQLFDLRTGNILDFGVDNFRDELCFTNHPEISGYGKKNRQILKKILEDEGFSNYILEYWHFSYGDTEWAVYQKKDTAIYGTISLENKK